MVLVKDLIKSKTMVMVLIFMLGISYLGAISNKNLELSYQNTTNIAYNNN